MARRTNQNPSDGNWVLKDTKRSRLATASEVLVVEKAKEKKRKVEYVPHPILPKTFIRRFLD